jgi:predicted transcriptional regulator
MPGDQITTRGEILSLTSEIVAAHVANNSVRTTDVGQLIQSIFDTLSALASDRPTSVVLTPVVPIRKSVTDDYLVCLEDGRKQKMLKRHLMTDHDMTPEEYRAKWGLRPDYPMVAPSYARKRQELAKQYGLGRKKAPAPKRKAKRSLGRSAAQ